MNYEKTTRLSVHALTVKIDEGAIYAQKGVAIESEDTPSSLLYKLSKLAGKVIVDAMEAVVNEDEIVSEEKGFYVKKISAKEYALFRTLNRLRMMLRIAPKRYLLK
jgi:methionyl-tRNA formyltransferase